MKTLSCFVSYPIFLKNIWDFYLIAQRFESWNLNNISTNKVNETIELFFQKHKEITNFLENINI